VRAEVLKRQYIVVF